MRKSTVRKFQPHLIALRRYAKALTGSDALVDGVVAEARDRDYRGLLQRELRVRLFRDFHDVLGNGALLDRYALMLRHVQGFALQEVAAILRSDVLALQARLETAYGDLHRQGSSDVLLIQEDPVLASGMTEMIESLGHRVLGVARDEDEALVTAQSIRLDAVVADISATGRNEASPMARLLGQIKAPIVFVTPDTDEEAGRHYRVTTPFQAPELKVMLSEALRRTPTQS